MPNDSQTSTRTGQCMCGAVRFTAHNVENRYNVCHCEMCQQWSGSAFMSFMVAQTDIEWEGEAQIKTLQSSDWAERAWCRRCGSGLYYHVTDDTPFAKILNMQVGLLDDKSGMRMGREIYHDCRMPGLDIEGDRSRLSRKETLKLFGVEE